MKHTQVLSSGITVRQDVGDAVRAIFFQTDHEEWLYATDSGTAFIVRYNNRLYGLTCRHVLTSFNAGRLFLTPQKFGKKGDLPAHVTSLFHPSSPREEAVGTDVTDICVIQFAPDIASDFFRSTEYVLDEKTWGTSSVGHRLRVHGVLKEKSSIELPDIRIGFCNLEFQDNGPYPSDPFLRQAIAEYARPEFNSITGISGAPVFDETANVLCGMVVRGNLTGNRCQILYFDVSDVVRAMDAGSRGLASIRYNKIIRSPTSSTPAVAARVLPRRP